MNYHKDFDFVNCLCEYEVKNETTKHYEGVFTQGSGYMHARGSYEEGLEGASQKEEYMRLAANVTIEKPRNPRSKWGTYIPLITGRHPILKEEMINLPYMMSFKVFSNGIALDMGKCRIEKYRRTLDLRDGVLYREFEWVIDGGTIVKCFYERYISRAQKNLIVQMMSFTAIGGDCNIEFVSGIEEGVRTNGYNHFKSIKKSALTNQVNLHLVTDNDDEVLMSSRTFSSQMRFFPDNDTS